ncbi:MAG: hypothetical protein JW819_11475 [Candidatus Krumholzibacteriota bacterium]|nr:hypothetical protein [Candidatus Krumholzibacteriota bacterium]
MAGTAERLEYWLREILPLPTAPFHEDAIIARVRRLALERGLRVRADRAGNQVLEYRREGKTVAPVAFTCHMDHPGFEVAAARGRRATLRLLGGVDEPTLRGSRIVVHTAGGPVRCRTRSVRMSPDRRKRHTHVTVASEAPLRAGEWGHFDLVPLSLARGRITSKALDNVLSAALILALLDQLAATRRRAHVYGVFTVAEEVGFVGAMELVKGRLLPRRVPVVVMETSRELPGFSIGAGPVVRVGDRISVYDDGVTRWLGDTAAAIAKRDKTFRWQRALMPGGMCEATLFNLAGYRAGALALALANYHNMGPRGAAAERVDRRDAEQMLQLLETLAARGPRPGADEALCKRIETQHRRYRVRLNRR